SLSEVTESFENSQLVFIHDQLTNTYHNLSASAYTFISEEGTFDNRLVVVFTSILSNDNPIQTNTNVWVYKRGNQWTASVAGNTTIESVMVYDLQGRTLYEAKALQTNQHNIKNLMDANAIFIVHVVTADGKTHIIKTAN
ncbi:MAG: T9SS sorting signal type C domain-containing protein, partial [Flavobacterium sp.]